MKRLALCGVPWTRPCKAGVSLVLHTPKSSRSIHAGTLLLTVLAGVAFACSRNDRAADPAIAAAVAQHLDSVNGLPTVVVNGFWCDHGVEECVPNSSGPPLSPIDATAFASALAAAREIPLAQPRGFRSPACPWTATEPGHAGLYAQFLRPPAIDADSAIVELSTGCNDNGAAFEQVHLFILYRDSTGWVVARRERVSIT